MNKLIAFISYAVEDEGLALKLQETLKLAFGFDAFAFRRSLVLSQKTSDTIINKLAKSDLFIPLISHNYEKSAYSNQEAGIAICLKKKIIPPIIDDTKVPCGFMSIYWGGDGLKVTQSKYIAENIAALIFLSVFTDDESSCFRKRARKYLVDALCNSTDFGYSNPAMRAIIKVEGLSRKQVQQIYSNTKTNRNIHAEQFIFPMFRDYLFKKYHIDILS